MEKGDYYPKMLEICLILHTILGFECNWKEALPTSNVWKPLKINFAHQRVVQPSLKCQHG